MDAQSRIHVKKLIGAILDKNYNSAQKHLQEAVDTKIKNRIKLASKNKLFDK